MRSKRVFEIVLALLVTTSVGTRAQVNLNKLGQSTMDFLLVSVSPEASGMGEAYSAFGTGADAMFYNPAGLAEMNTTYNASVNFTQWIADINYYAGAISWKIGNYGVVGVNLLSVDYGTLIGTTIDVQKGYLDTGPIPNVGAYSFGISYAKAISSQFMVGGTVKYAGQNLGVNNFVDGTSVKNDAAKLAFDIGVKYYTSFNDFRFGMAIRNFASDVTREVYAEQLPLLFTVGGAIDLMDFVDQNHDKGTALTLAADFLHPNNYSERFNLGMEYKVLGMLALRGGYQTNRDIQSWSAGAGFNVQVGGTAWEVNYSFSKMDVFTNVNRFSLVASF
ncbi:MAG TPA: PorV/PorQ family protein [Candidatus Acidoferrales bacterium]|nr:PorV/PorQ family protein [Candidatus Acidoferrales bacterium]